MAHTRTIKHVNHSVDMSKGSIVVNILRFAIPMALASMLHLLFNAADMVVVGQFDGERALAAVGSTGSTVNLFVSLFNGLSVGVTVTLAKWFGAKSDKDISETVHTAVAVAIVCGIMLTIVGIVFAEPLLRLLDCPEEVLPLSTLYMRIYFGGMLFTMIYSYCSAVLRATGDTKRPLVFLAIGGVLNVLLNLLFVAVFRIGVAGVAIATVISQALSAFLVVLCLIKEESAIRLYIKKIGFYKGKTADILRIGIPAGIQSSLFSVSNMVIQRAINAFGEYAMAGTSAASSIEGFVYVGMEAIHQGTVAFVAQNIGAGKKDRIHRSVPISLTMVFVAGVSLGLLVVFNAEFFVRIFTTDTQAIAYGIERIQMVSATYFLCGMMSTIGSYPIGAGRTLMPTIINLVGICVLRVIYIFTLFNEPYLHTLKGLYLCYPISWIVAWIALYILYLCTIKIIDKQCLEHQKPSGEK